MINYKGWPVGIHASGFLRRLEGSAFALVAGVAAFLAYAGVYALRKPFTAASFSDLSLWGVQYKIALVAAQVAGYALSKCIGIRLIAGMGSERRAVVFLGLTGMALLSLLGLGLSPWPWGVFWMFLNGLPLGLAWGVVFSYLEGRRITDALAAFLCVNFIFSSGFVKTIGQWLMLRHGVGEFWMPFCVGALFLPLLLACLWILEQLPPPTVADVALRSERKPMTRQQQNALFGRYRLGLLLLAAIYLLLTVVRDVRDNFAVELWAELGMGGNPGLLTTAELPIVLCVLLLVAALSALRDSFQALWAIHAAVVFGAVLAMGATLLFRMGHLSPLTWMVSSGTGIFGAYILFNGVIYDRLLAAFQEKGNVGFLIYMADAVGYLGSVAVLLWRNFGEPNTAWVPFYAQLCLVANGAALVLTIGAWAYFAHLKRVFYNG